MSDKDTLVKVSYNNNDIILKLMAQAFKDTTLDFLGLHVPKIKSVIPTELPILDVKDESMDFVFLLEDDSYLHLEFQTTNKPSDLVRFAIYDYRLFERDHKSIKTIVIYSANIKNTKQELKIGPDVYYKVDTIYIGDFDGDKIFEELKDKILTGQNINDNDKLNLIFLPLMKISCNKNEMAIKSIQLAKEIIDTDQKMFCIAAIIGISDKFIDKEYIGKLMEVFSMTRIGYQLKQEGKQEGKLEAVFSVLTGFLGVIPGEYTEKLNKASNESLEKILKNIKEITKYDDVDKYL